ncbi:MAG: 6-phosphogluconolactonase [Gammaproteobacteria bacterium]|nr:6-phosphogluconolactonase [Gammaproteobacteria bacterium]
MHTWHVYTTKDLAVQAVTEFLASNIQQVLQSQQQCHIALPGGNTPVPCLKKLSTMDFPWQRIHWYLGDERCYPAGHPDRNDTMIRKYLWSKIESPESNNHPIAAELGPEKAAQLYGDEIDNLPALDIVFLGMGEDGHTASLFPDNEALHNDMSVVPVFNAPKPPDKRVSLGRSTLKSAKLRIVLALGEGKQSPIQKIKKGIALPVNTIGDIEWFVDEKAVK